MITIVALLLQLFSESAFYMFSKFHIICPSGFSDRSFFKKIIWIHYNSIFNYWWVAHFQKKVIQDLWILLELWLLLQSKAETMIYMEILGTLETTVSETRWPCNVSLIPSSSHICNVLYWGLLLKGKAALFGNCNWSKILRPSFGSRLPDTFWSASHYLRSFFMFWAIDLHGIPSSE